MFRHGKISTLEGDVFAIQKKKWYGWQTVNRYSSRELMMKAVKNSRDNGQIVL